MIDREIADRPDAAIDPTAVVADDPWRLLGRFTEARIGLGRSGVSLPTNRALEFQLAHARARDAVHLPLDTDRLIDELSDPDRLPGLPAICRLHSGAGDRNSYLQRPDHGRRLDAVSREALTALAAPPSDLAIVIADGLSSLAVQHHATRVVEALLEALSESAPGSPPGTGWELAPVCVVEQGRVAVGDEVGALLNARAVLVLIGERPGLSAPDSLGLYLTWNPRPGLTDADRNCISNVRPGGLEPSVAALRLQYLLAEAQTLGRTGVELKDRSGEIEVDNASGTANFLLP